MSEGPHIRNFEEDIPPKLEFGLALSGGGMRSMIVALGVLSSIFEIIVQKKGDFELQAISAVSGSTYALAAWLSHFLRTIKNETLVGSSREFLGSNPESKLLNSLLMISSN